MSKITLFFFYFCLIHTTINAQPTWINQVYEPNVKNIEYNPMKGLIPGYADVNSNFPYSIDHFYIDLKSVYKDWGKCDWQTFEDGIARIVAGGRHAIARFYIDYPRKPNLMPDFLSNQVPMMDENTPDWNNETLLAALEDFIAQFGAKYDGDSRLAMIEAGLYGYWGEWHCHPNSEWQMLQVNKDRIITAYNKAFTKTHIALRHAGHLSSVDEAKKFGYYDDSFCFQTLGDNGDWCFMHSLRRLSLTDNYKNRPIGGEIRPEIQSKLFNEWPNNIGEDISQCVNETHMSFCKAYFLFKSQPNVVQFKNALRMHTMMGYQFFVHSVKIGICDTTSFNVKVNIENRGVAPIYYNWLVEFSAINSEGEWLGHIGVADWEINTLYPSSNYYTRIFQSTVPLSGKNKLLMRFKNPLEEYTPNAFVLRFANQKQDVDREGWLTLGTVDNNNTKIEIE